MPDDRPRHCYACGGRLAEKRIHEAVRLVCPDCQTISYRNSKPCVGALIVDDGRLLLTRRGIEPFRDYWDIPGGFLEYGEPPEDGLRRELQEELGLAVEIESMLGFFMDEYGEGGVSILVILYRCRALHEPAFSGDDVVDYRWFPLGDLPDDLGFKSTHEGLRVLLNGGYSGGPSN